MSISPVPLYDYLICDILCNSSRYGCSVSWSQWQESICTEPDM